MDKCVYSEKSYDEHIKRSKSFFSVPAFLAKLKKQRKGLKWGGGGPTPNMLEFAIWGWGKMGKSGEKWGKFKTSKFMFRENFQIYYSS